MAHKIPQHNWDEYFMAVASLCSKFSEHTVGGACIVDNQRRIVGFGYTTCNNNAKKKKKDDVQHAEINAINNKTSNDLKGCTIYVISSPCNKCTNSIIESGITTVIYVDEIRMKEKNKMDAAGVTYRKYNPHRSKILNSIKRDEFSHRKFQ